MNEILQGTTPSFVIEIPEEIPVSTISALELAFNNGRGLQIYHLADVSLDADLNAIVKPFTEIETLSLMPCDPMYWQLRFRTPDGIFGTRKARVNVEDLMSQEVLS